MKLTLTSKLSQNESIDFELNPKRTVNFLLDYLHSNAIFNDTFPSLPLVLYSSSFEAISPIQLHSHSYSNEFVNEAGEYDQAVYNKYKLDEMENVKEKVKYTLQLTLTKIDDEWKMDDLTETEKQKIHGIYDY